MSVLALDQAQADRELAASADVLATWRDRLRQSEADRRRYEPIWQMCQAFAQGHQWVGWDVSGRRVVELPNPQSRVRHTVDVITKHVSTQQGKLVVDDLKPDISFRRRDRMGRDYAQHTKLAFDWGWDEEFGAEEAYNLASMKRLTYGFGFLRVRFDPTKGKVVGRIPVGPDNTPLTEDELAELERTGKLGDGRLPQFMLEREGAILWEPGGPFNFYPPPGVEHEMFMPWIIIGRPYPLAELRGAFPKAAALQEEALRQVDSVGMRSFGDSEAPAGNDSFGSARLREHSMVYTGYEFPCPDYPQGRTVIWSQERTLLEQDRLPLTVNGQPKAGLVCLKYHPVDGRFWPKGLVQPMIGPQRQKNVARSQMIEIKDRIGLPRIFAHENSITEDNVPTGLPAEVIQVRTGYEFPREVQGVGPGPWIRDEADMNDKDLGDVSGIGELSLSQVPAGVSAYSAFALLVEQDDRRIGPIRKRDRRILAELSKYTLAAMKIFWPVEKHIDIGGEDDDFVDSIVYTASQMPDSIFTRVSTSAPLPQSQAAVAQLIQDMFNAAIASGQPLPIDWLDESYRIGRPAPLPKREMMVQRDSAELENHLLISGQMVGVQPWHNDELHVEVHRSAQEAYALIGQQMPQAQGAAQLLEMHIQQHVQNAQQKQAQRAIQAGGQAPSGNNAAGFGALQSGPAGQGDQAAAGQPQQQIAAPQQ